MEGKKLQCLQPDGMGDRLLRPDGGRSLFEGTPHLAGRAARLIEGRPRSLLASARIEHAQEASRRRAGGPAPID